MSRNARDILSGSAEQLNAHAMAMGAGALVVAVRDEIQTVLAKNRGHREKALVVGIEHLHKQGLITEAEAVTLQRVTKLVFAIVRAKIDRSAGQAELAAICNQLLVDFEASPVALAIASSVNAVVSLAGAPKQTTQAQTKMAAMVIPNGNGADALAGATVGAIVGGVLGGVVGAVVGGIVGAAVGNACSDGE